MQTFNLGQTSPHASLTQALNQNMLIESGFNAPYGAMKQGFATGLSSVVARQAAHQKMNDTMNAQMALYDMAAKQKAAETADQRAYQEYLTADQREYQQGLTQSQRDYETAKLNDERAYKYGIDLENRLIKEDEADKADAETIDALQAQLEAIQEGMGSVAGAYKPDSEQQMAVMGQVENIRRALSGGRNKGRLAGYLKGITDSGFSSGFNVGALGTAGAKPVAPAAPQQQKPANPFDGWSGSHLSN